MNRLGLTRELVGIDTNVVLRAVLDDDPEQSPLARQLFRGLSEERPGLIDTVTMAEVYWLLCRRKRLSKVEALAVIRRLIEIETLEFVDGEGVAHALMLAEEGADFADALIHESFQQFGTTENVTFDRGASRRLGWQLLKG